MNSASKPTSGGFAKLTERQSAVLDLLANGRTTKEIAAALDISYSAANRSIELLRNRFGSVTRAELARRYRDWKSTENQRLEPVRDGEDSSGTILQLAGHALRWPEKPQDAPGAEPVFRDALSISIEAPWSPDKEPRIVPRVLDGDNAVLARGTAIVIILVGIVASLVLGLAAALAITDALGK